MSHAAGPWEFVSTTYGDGSPAYAVKSVDFGYIVAYASGQTDAEALSNAHVIAQAVTAHNRRNQS